MVQYQPGILHHIDWNFFKGHTYWVDESYLYIGYDNDREHTAEELSNRCFFLVDKIIQRISATVTVCGPAFGVRDLTTVESSQTRILYPFSVQLGPIF